MLNSNYKVLLRGELMETNFNKHWHTHKDDMDNIDKNTLNAVGQTLLEIIYNE